MAPEPHQPQPPEGQALPTVDRLLGPPRLRRRGRLRMMFSGATKRIFDFLAALGGLAALTRAAGDRLHAQHVRHIRRHAERRDALPPATDAGALDDGVRAGPAPAVVVDTESGYTARIISAYRGSVPIYATSPHMRVVRELSLSYGVNASYLPKPKSTYDLVRSSLAILLDNASITLDDLVVIIAGTPGRSTGSNFIELNTARQCLIDRI